MVAGPSGPQGLQGSQGPQGSTGLAGVQGYSVPGAQGNQGTEGNQGFGGAQGLQGLTGGAGGSALVLIESQIVPSHTQTVTFSNLDGDSDRFYLLKFKVKKNGGGSGTAYNYYLRPNGVTSNLSSQQFFPFMTTTGGSSGVSTSSDASAITLFGTTYQIGYWDGFVHISAEKTVPRLFNIRSDRYTDNAAGTIQLGLGRTSGRWNETSTNLTSLVIHCSQASGIAAGSDFHLYKYIV
jgi:hypothetical protein